MAVASFLVQTVSGIREGNEVQVEDESDFNVYASDAAMSSSGCLTKLSVKQAELVQKFVPRSRVGIFRNEHTRSTPLDPKLMFRSVSYYLGGFGTV